MIWFVASTLLLIRDTTAIRESAAQERRFAEARVVLQEVQTRQQLGDIAARLGVADADPSDQGEISLTRLRAEIAAVNLTLLNRQRAAGDALAQSVWHRERLAILACGALLLALVMAAIQVARLLAAHKNAEAALRLSEDFLQRTNRVAGIGGWELDLVTGELYWSQQVRRIHGVTDDYVPTLQSAVSFYAAEAQLLLGAALEEARLHATPWDLELAFTPTSGHLIYVRAVGAAECDPEGTPVRLIGTFQDITDRKCIERELRDLTEVFDNTTDFVAQSDSRGKLLYLNKSARQALGFDPEMSLEPHTLPELFTPETNELFRREIVPTVARELVWVGETQMVLKQGWTIPVSHMVVGHLDSQGQVSRYSTIMRDITVEVAARHALARQTASLNTVVEAIPAMVAVFDRDMRFVLVNRAYERWRGLPREQLTGRFVGETMGPIEYERNRRWALRALGGETVCYEEEYPQAPEIRHVQITYIPLRMPNGAIEGYFGVAQDITSHREENIRLTILSTHDPLTGALNRAGIDQFIESRVSAGEGATLAAICIDLDHFKPVNDTYGHEAGDRVLQEFSARLQRLVKPSDAVARLGGDEFAVILRGVRDIAEAARMAEAVAGAAQSPFFIDKHTHVSISASIGVACNTDAAGGWKALMAQADALAYQAKWAGRGRVASTSRR
jgi:diguanylate cyclase (GGDEF)-like protein/PAS domain S-box-containing protein